MLDTVEQQVLRFQECQKEAGNTEQEWRKAAKRGKKRRQERAWPSRRHGMETLESIKSHWYTLVPCKATAISAMSAESR